MREINLSPWTNKRTRSVTDSPTRNEPPPEDPSDLTGTKIGRYLVESLIGRGGMGEVYKATDPVLNRKVALKRLSRRQDGGEEERRRVLREARRASTITDPRIAAVYDVLDLEDEVILVMEHIEGRTLRAVIADRPSVEDFWPIAEECTQALAVAHREGVLHRDIKPENIMITTSGGVKVLDFGLARPLATQDGAADTLTTLSIQDPKLAGTPPYMAPESLLGGQTDERADIFSLGVTFYELLTGARPFVGPTHHAVAQEILNTEPMSPTESNPEIPDSLSTVVMRMLSKDPADRYATVEDVYLDLKKAREGLEIPSLPPRDRGKERVSGRRWVKVIPAAAVLVIVVLILLLGGHEWIRDRFGWYPLPSKKSVVLLPFEAEGDNEELAAMALGMSNLLGSALVGLSSDSSLYVAPFMETLWLAVDKPPEGREFQGANLVFQSVLRRDGQSFQGTVKLLDPASGRRLRSRRIEAPRSKPYEFLERTFLEMADMLGFSPERLDPRRLTVYGNEGAGLLRFYLGGLGRILEVQRGSMAVSSADTTQIREALKSFERAANIDPDHAPSLSGFSEACRRMFKASGNTVWLDRGEDAARRAVSLDDGLADAHIKLSFIHWARGGQHDLAIEEMERALAIDPLDHVILFNLSGYYRLLGRVEEQERLYLAAIEERPHDWRPHWWLALRIYYRQGRLPEALATLELVVRLAPDNYRGYQSLGGLQVLDGNYEEAARNLEKSISIHPSSEALSNLGVAYFNMRDFDRCIQTFNEVFQHTYGDYEDWLNLGDAYYWAGGKRDKAAKAYDEAVRLGRLGIKENPANNMIRANMAQIYPKISQPDSAVAYIETAVAGEPENPMIQYCAAITYWQLGQRDKALDWLERSVAGGYSVSWLRDSPMFDEWRSEERFQAILTRPKDEG
jgi:serine/threonine-protein kinase